MDVRRSRRAFMDATLRAGAGFALARSSFVDLFAQGSLPASQLIVHSARPQDLETPVHLLTSWITPNDLFYVRSHFYTPAVGEESWRLQVDGDVTTPLTLTMDALMRMPSTTMPVTLECAGNGRGYYDPPVAGVQWRRGAVGTARWTGVPLADVLTRAGIKSTSNYVWADGADVGLGRAPDFIRSVPIDKVMRGDVLLAYAMNGERLSPSHGFPLRLVVPGWEGAYSVKWLTRITASDRDHPGPFVATSYRMPRSPVTPGSVVGAADTVPIRGLMVKSIITSPDANAVVSRGAPVTIAGFAWGGEQDIDRVDVSTDNGRTWKPATLGGDRARYTWRRFEYAWVPDTSGPHVVLSRATDASGRMQPAAGQWNPGGYLWNGLDRVRVQVTGPDEAARAEDLLKSRCTPCHATDLIDAQRLDAEGWDRELAKMQGWGAQLSPEEHQLLVNHLVQRAK
jgi:DMSO/TMAO reductase YedYZ molybdopterin-dependent catalytic subunit